MDDRGGLINASQPKLIDGLGCHRGAPCHSSVKRLADRTSPWKENGPSAGEAMLLVRLQ